MKKLLKTIRLKNIVKPNLWYAIEGKTLGQGASKRGGKPWGGMARLQKGNAEEGSMGDVLGNYKGVGLNLQRPMGGGHVSKPRTVEMWKENGKAETTQKKLKVRENVTGDEVDIF